MPVDTLPTAVKFPALAVLLMVRVLPVIPVAELSRPTLAAPVMLSELPDAAPVDDSVAPATVPVAASAAQEIGVHARREHSRAVRPAHEGRGGRGRLPNPDERSEELQPSARRRAAAGRRGLHNRPQHPRQAHVCIKQYRVKG